MCEIPLEGYEIYNDIPLSIDGLSCLYNYSRNDTLAAASEPLTGDKFKFKSKTPC